MSEDDLKVETKQSMATVPAPELPYLPPVPQSPEAIGVIGCGGVMAFHLDAYRGAGFDVRALCDVDEARAAERRDAYFPDAAITSNYAEVLGRTDIGIVDIATHPEIRGPMIEAALEAGKHVLSQKPFVLDLDEGERLAALAEAKGLRLAVNQNGRWAPHFGYLREAIAADCVGRISAAHLAVHWDHRWTKGTVFDELPHMILYDFGIHWFDMLTCFFEGREARRVFATVQRAVAQENTAPMLAQVVVDYGDAQASLSFDAATPYGALDTTYVAGTAGSLRSEGPDLGHQCVTMYTDAGVAEPALEGEWFKNGFLGTMSELMCAIEEDRVPSNNARDNLNGLALCFAAMASADSGKAVVPGSIRKI